MITAGEDQHELPARPGDRVQRPFAGPTRTAGRSVPRKASRFDDASSQVSVELRPDHRQARRYSCGSGGRSIGGRRRDAAPMASSECDQAREQHRRRPGRRSRPPTRGQRQRREPRAPAEPVAQPLEAPDRRRRSGLTDQSSIGMKGRTSVRRTRRRAASSAEPDRELDRDALRRPRLSRASPARTRLAPRPTGPVLAGKPRAPPRALRSRRAADDSRRDEATSSSLVALVALVAFVTRAAGGAARALVAARRARGLRRAEDDRRRSRRIAPTRMGYSDTAFATPELHDAKIRTNSRLTRGDDLGQKAAPFGIAAGVRRPAPT